MVSKEKAVGGQYSNVSGKIESFCNIFLFANPLCRGTPSFRTPGYGFCLRVGFPGTQVVL